MIHYVMKNVLFPVCLLMLSSGNGTSAFEYVDAEEMTVLAEEPHESSSEESAPARITQDDTASSETETSSEDTESKKYLSVTEVTEKISNGNASDTKSAADNIPGKANDINESEPASDQIVAESESMESISVGEDESFSEIPFENGGIYVPDEETILSNEELMEELALSKNDLECMDENEINDIDHFIEFAALYPDIFIEKQIVYAVPMNESPDDVCLSVYKKNGMYYSCITDINDPNRENQSSRFIANIDRMNPAVSSESEHQRNYTIHISRSFYDTYTEAGFQQSGLKGSYDTTFYITRIITTDGDHDLCTVADYNFIHPYAGAAMATTKYTHGIARYITDTMIVSGTPETSLANAHEFSYGVSIGFPWNFGVSFGWNGSSGTKIRAGVTNTMHDIVFTNPDGIFGDSEDGSFSYATTTLFYLPKTTKFAFQYNQLIYNAVYGNQSGMVKYGDYWYLVFPPVNSTDESSDDNAGNSESSSVYIYNGIDYSPVFNAEYYSGKYEDLRSAFGTNQAALFQHFVNNGMDEARQASENFNPVAYRNRYADLQSAFGDNWRQYYLHYLNNGIKEGRIGN